MQVLVTGANGFIGSNLVSYINEIDGIDVVEFTRQHTLNDLPKLVSNIDAVIHLAGVNRPKKEEEFTEGNYDLSVLLCQELSKTERQIPIIFASSIQADLDNAYGKTKKAAEEILDNYSKETGSQVYIYRLPNVFGKWCRPNYNSVVATFCHNIANDIPIEINDPEVILNLLYIDDVVKEFISVLSGENKSTAPNINPVYTIKLGDLAEKIYSFKDSRNTLVIDRVGNGLTRALYATYLTYLKPEKFSYALEVHEDKRGVFSEVLKTKDSGQFSMFTAHPGISRGGHYHHSKNEKFLVIKGQARFRFRNILTDEKYEIFTSAENIEVVESIPGWVHDITNMGDDEMIVMLWSNEIYDQERPDTINSKI